MALKEIDAVNHRWRDRLDKGMSWLWFSCLALLFLLPPVSFAQSHLWQYRPFRANDTDHSGGDHICDLRRDSNADGKPDRLGDFVSVRGSVIVEPSTFDTGDRLFWIREGTCGILVYGEPEDLGLGDSVVVRGRLRFSSGNLILPDIGPTGLTDVILRKGGTAVRCGRGEERPLPVPPEDFVGNPAYYCGNLVTLTGPVHVTRTLRTGAGAFAWASSGVDTVTICIPDNVSASIVPGRCYIITGVVIGLSMASGSAAPVGWCIVPRSPTDVVEAGCSAAREPLSWGRVKSEYSP